MAQLKRSQSDRVLLGVCGGIADFFGVPSLFIRALFIFLPVSFFAYLLMGFFIPEDGLL